jgi:protein-tyrosine phosphatase
VIHVLFVCLGNICRSPMAQGVFEARVREEGLSDYIACDSAGTGQYHTGSTPDARACAATALRGIDLSAQRARQVREKDFLTSQYILAMDRQNLRILRKLVPPHYTGQLALFLDYAPQLAEREIPDPYFGGPEGFTHVLDLVGEASVGLLADIRMRHLARYDGINFS